ncbi:hypothetical protein ABG067_002717 [Albugo candida]
MCTCANDTAGLEGLSANYIALMACITGGGVAFGLESSFVREVITDQQLQAYSSFRDLHHIQCSRSCYDLDKHIQRVKLVDQLATKGSFGDFSGLEDHCYGSGSVEQNPSPIAKWRAPISEALYVQDTYDQHV